MPRRLFPRRRRVGHALALIVPVLLLLAPPARAQPRAAAAPPPVFLDELTWTEVRDRQIAGARTILIATAGQEQKGPHMVDGKHKFVMEHTATRIARALGDALVAPIITYVPEGRWDPPRGHMTKPGSSSGTSPSSWSGGMGRWWTAMRRQ